MAPPGGGRNDVSGRFLRHLQVISVDEFDEPTMCRIFTAISDWHFSRGFDAVFTRMAKVRLSVSRDVNRGQMLEAKAEAEAKFNRPSPRPKLKRPNRTLYFTFIFICISA